MFRMTTKTKEILEGGGLSKRQLAAKKRQLVYEYILKHPDAGSNVELAKAAGYNMDLIASPEYQNGSHFIWKMIKDGYIQKETSHGMTCFYLGDKEPVDIQSPAKLVKSQDDYLRVRVAEQELQEQIEEYEEDHMGPEGQTKEDWATDDPIDDFPGAEEQTKLLSGSVELSGGEGVSFKITFDRKTRAEIIDIINNINTEFLL